MRYFLQFLAGLGIGLLLGIAFSYCNLYLYKGTATFSGSGGAIIFVVTIFFSTILSGIIFFIACFFDTKVRRWIKISWVAVYPLILLITIYFKVINTKLHNSIKSCDATALKTMIFLGARGHIFSNPLDWDRIRAATKCEDIEVAKVVLKHLVKHSNPHSCLFLAARNQNMTLIKYFIDEYNPGYVDVSNIQYLIDKETALFCTLHPNTFWKPGIREKEQMLFRELKKNNADPEIIRSQLLSGINVNCKDDLSTTPVIIAAAKNDTVLLKIMLDKGADPNWKNRFNLSAFDFAVINNNMEIINILFEHTASNFFSSIEYLLRLRFRDIKNEKMIEIILNYVSHKKDGIKLLERFYHRPYYQPDKIDKLIEKYLYSSRAQLPESSDGLKKSDTLSFTPKGRFYTPDLLQVNKSNVRYRYTNANLPDLSNLTLNKI